ncbi:MAG TPA: ABC transporter permease [Bacillota bacterium]
MALPLNRGPAAALSRGGRAGGSRPLRERDAFALGMLAPALLWQALFYVVPLLLIVGTSLWAMENYRLVVEWSFDNYRTVLTDALYRSPYGTSLLLAGAVVLVTAVVAYPLAYGLAFIVPPRLRPLLIVGLVAPFWTNYLVRAYAWQILIGNNGVWNYLLTRTGLLDQPVPLLNTGWAAGIGLTHYLLPVVTLTLYTTMENINRNLLEAALDLGASRWSVFRHVVFPLSRPGLAVGAVLAFVLAFTDFISPAVLGGQNIRVVPQLVVDAVQWNVDYPRAAAMAVLMIVVILAVVAALRRALDLPVERAS